MKKILMSSLMVLVSACMFAATHTWTNVLEIKLTDGNNDTYTSRFGEASDLSNTALWSPSAATFEGATVKAYVEYQGVNYEKLYLNDFADNTPLIVKTYNSDQLTFNLKALYGTVTLHDNADGTDYTVDAAGTATLSQTFTVATNATIADRFVIFYVPAPTCDYSREGLVVGRYYTICLPYAVENPAGASFWNMSKRNAAGTLAYLEEVEGGLEAGKPYIFQAEAASLCFEYSGEEASAGTNGVLVGTFEPLTQTALNATNTFLLYNNELYRVDGGSGNSLGANRAYINYNAFVVANEAPQSAPGRRVRAVPMQANGTTGIENIKASEAPAKMIIDGKMFIIRGEQMFDATGRLVK